MCVLVSIPTRDFNQTPWLAMQSKNLLCFTRSITTSVLHTLPASSSMHDFKPNTNDQVYFNNQRINNLIKSGYLNSALQLFDEMPNRDAISFNLVIAAHARHGCPELALGLYDKMVSRGIRENPSTFSSVLSVCSNGGFHREGLQVHCRVICLGFSTNAFVGSALIDLYMQIGLTDVALRMFDEMPERNLATWNLILRGFCELGYVYELLELFVKMGLDGIEGNGVSFSYVIRGCSIEKLLEQGKRWHCCVIKLGVEPNMFVANALVDFYSACECLVDARKVVEGIPADDVISWNSIISISASKGFWVDAIELFSRMRSWGKKPSVRSFVGFLNLSSDTQNFRLGEQIHCFVKKLGFNQGSVHVQSALIDMYGKCGKIASSVSVFEEIPRRSIECCNSLMTSLLHCGIIEDVIEMFGLMVDESVGLDDVAFSTTLKALSSSASVSLMSIQVVHCCVIKSGFASDKIVSCSLIDAYSRSGHIEFSRKIFDQTMDLNLICYTSMITGLSCNGMGKEGLQIFELLINRGLKPDAITFLSVLSGCNHSGMVEEGLSVFKSMKTIHKIHPDRRHFSCMVDLLGRAGLLEEAEKLLTVANFKSDPVIWSSLLRSCRVHRNEEVGKRAAKVLMELQPDNPATYVQASGFYSEIGDMEAAMRIKELRMRMNMTREFGHSLIEINNQVCR